MNIKSKIGKSELLWVTGYDADNNLKYVISSNSDRSWYYVYDKEFKKLGKARTPAELQEKYFGKG